MKVRNLALALLAVGIVGVAPLGALAQDKPAAKPRAGQMDPKLQQQMIDRMKGMQAQMDRMRQTTDPKEREKLMAEHMKSMQEGMQMMRGMGGGMMMGGGGMMGGGMGGGMKGSGPRGGSGSQSMPMMEGRMDMMQMMMEQMMQHQQMMQGR